MKRFVFSLVLAGAALAGSAGSSRIEQQVGHELRMLPYYGVFDNLTYKVDGNTVTISGDVTQPVLKSDAERAVKKVEGVEVVRNEIQVLPLSPFDDRIRLAAARAIYNDATLSRYALQANPPIHIDVRNGMIRLEGVVATLTEKNLAFIRASGVAGAFRVENNLAIER